MIWNSFLKKEFISVVKKYNNLSTSRLDKLSWRYFKIIVKDNACLNKFIDIANICIDLEHQPSHFKMSTTIVILKLNKKSYNFSKAYQPIVLLNIIGKLIKKVISKRMQFTMISNNFIHLYQLGDLKQISTFDARVILIYFIHIRQIKKYTTSILTFDIAQFFPLLNYHLFLSILVKASFKPKVLIFFHNYLVDRKTKYL